MLWRKESQDPVDYRMLTAMLYGQSTSAFGMREIVKTLEANRHKLYHSGLSEVKSSTTRWPRSSTGEPAGS